KARLSAEHEAEVARVQRQNEEDLGRLKKELQTALDDTRAEIQREHAAEMEELRQDLERQRMLSKSAAESTIPKPRQGGSRKASPSGTQRQREREAEVEDSRTHPLASSVGRPALALHSHVHRDLSDEEEEEEEESHVQTNHRERERPRSARRSSLDVDAFSPAVRAQIQRERQRLRAARSLLVSKKHRLELRSEALRAARTHFRAEMASTKDAKRNGTPAERAEADHQLKSLREVRSQLEGDAKDVNAAVESHKKSSRWLERREQALDSAVSKALEEQEREREAVSLLPDVTPMSVSSFTVDSHRVPSRSERERERDLLHALGSVVVGGADSPSLMTFAPLTPESSVGTPLGSRPVSPPADPEVGAIWGMTQETEGDSAEEAEEAPREQKRERERERSRGSKKEKERESRRKSRRHAPPDTPVSEGTPSSQADSDVSATPQPSVRQRRAHHSRRRRYVESPPVSSSSVLSSSPTRDRDERRERRERDTHRHTHRRERERESGMHGMDTQPPQMQYPMPYPPGMMPYGMSGMGGPQVVYVMDSSMMGRSAAPAPARDERGSAIDVQGLLRRREAVSGVLARHADWLQSLRGSALPGMGYGTGPVVLPEETRPEEHRTE
ncbi:hypothetical protein KIPB_008864, partial [Kipferlia bialata]